LNTVIWIIFWVAITMLGIMPNEIANSLAEGLGFQDRPNAIIFVALGLLFLMVFYLSTTLNRVENQLTDLVRKLALSEAFQAAMLEKESTDIISPKGLTTIVKHKNNDQSESASESEGIIKNIAELEGLVNRLVSDTTSELPESIPNEGKMPKSKPKE